MIQLDSVTRQFGGDSLFEGLSWTIKPRARIGLVGPNGAGKTTLLRLLAGHDRPDAGEVHKPGKLQVGYLPQEVETVEGETVLGVALAGLGEVTRVGEQLAALERKLAGAEPGDPAVERLTEEYGSARSRFEALDGDRLESRAKAILSGLGVDTARFVQSPETLSGGWRMRAVLARLLVGAPGLLLLDEPTNHLDLESIGWLERFLEEYDGAFVAVSHDRYFLNRISESTVELDRGRLTTFAGNYDAYVLAKEQRDRIAEKTARQQGREIAKVERFIERFRYKNTKARQVQSRIRALDKTERLALPERDGKSIGFRFPEAPRSGDTVATIEGLRKFFGSARVYDGASLLLRRGDRLALVGPNGAGKSTLLKMLAGKLEPDGGRLELGHNVQVHYFAQHQLEALDPSRTVHQELESVVAPEDRSRLRGLAGRFGFSGDDVDKPVAVLSGGEKARLALAKMLTRPANLLLLDEPTNHLDLESREVLEGALNEFAGTLILISHDRYFINRVASGVVRVGDGGLERHDGNYDEFIRRRPELFEASPASEEPDRSDGSGPPHPALRSDRRREAEERNRRYRERKAIEDRLAPIEREVSELEQRQRELESRQAEPEVYSSPAAAREVAADKSKVETRLAELYAAWEEMAQLLD